MQRGGFLLGGTFPVKCHKRPLVAPRSSACGPPTEQSHGSLENTVSEAVQTEFLRYRLSSSPWGG